MLSMAMLVGLLADEAPVSATFLMTTAKAMSFERMLAVTRTLLGGFLRNA